MRKVNIIILILCVSVIFANGCARIYRITVKNPEGMIVNTYEFDSYSFGDTTYALDQRWHKDGTPQKCAVGFSRNISTLWQGIMDGLMKAIGAASDKF